MNITAHELKARLDRSPRDFRLIDVREHEEWAVAKIPGAELIPLSQFETSSIEKLEADDKIVLYCHHGMRSARAQGFLKAHGYQDVLNLTGGIDAWSTQIDPAVPRY